MHDEYYKEVFQYGPIILKVGESHDFTLEHIGGWPEEKLTMKMISIDGETALISVKGAEFTLERKMQQITGRLTFRGILFEDDSVTIVYGDQIIDF